MLKFLKTIEKEVHRLACGCGRRFRHVVGDSGGGISMRVLRGLIDILVMFLLG